MQNVGQCMNGDDEHKRISFAVIITITQSLEKEKDNPCRHKNTMAFAIALIGVLKNKETETERNELGEK